MHLRHLADQALHQRRRQLPAEVHLRLRHEGEARGVRSREAPQAEHPGGFQGLPEHQAHEHLPDLRLGPDRRRHRGRGPGGHGRDARRRHLRVQLPGLPRPQPVGRPPHHLHRLVQGQGGDGGTRDNQRLRDQLRGRIQHPGRSGGHAGLLQAHGHPGPFHLHGKRPLRRPARHAPRPSECAGMRPLLGVSLQRTARQVRHSPPRHRRLRL